MIDLLKKCFPEQFTAWEPKICEAIPSFGTSVNADPELTKQIEERTNKALGLNR